MAEPPSAMFIGASSFPTTHASRAPKSADFLGKAEVSEHDHHTGSADNAGKSASDVRISEEARAAQKARESEGASGPDEPRKVTAEGELSEAEKQQVKELKARDAEVRAHERAHVAAAGGHTKGGIKYETQRGPDNKEYAVGGHVNIDTAPVEGDPERTIRKAETVRRAALAPAEPSGADRGVAAAAQNTIRAARAEVAAEARAEVDESKESADSEQPDNSDDSLSSSSVPSSYALAAYQSAA